MHVIALWFFWFVACGCPENDERILTEVAHRGQKDGTQSQIYAMQQDAAI
jgi:hypothetical protein